MTKRPLFLSALICLAVAGATAAHAADEMPANDLREFRVGKPVSALSTDGYIDLACAAAPDVTLSNWSEFARCPGNAAGLHTVSFRYDASANPLSRITDNAQGTKVAGQPVTLELLIGDDGTIDGLHITTDPSVRLYAHRRAYLFGLQAKARYGEDGWQCAQQQPTPTEQPIGGTFVKEHCEKSANGRHYLVDRDLHRDPGQDISQFVSSSSVTILRAGQ